MDECLNFLETSPEAAPNDKRFVAWIRIQRLVEEVAMTFSLDDPGNTASLCDTRVQQMLKGFEKQLDDLMKSMKAAPGVLNGECITSLHYNRLRPNHPFQGSLRSISMSTIYTSTRLLYIRSMTLKTSSRPFILLPQIPRSERHLGRPTCMPSPSV